jgi:hypothetical protein
MRKIEAPRNITLDDFREISSNYTRFRIIEKIRKRFRVSNLIEWFFLPFHKHKDVD